MKILIIQECGRHEKNKNFRESLCFKRAFDQLKVDSIIWGLNYETFNIPFEKIADGCDLLLLLENYNSGWLPNLKAFKGIKLFWSIDSHCVLNNHLETCRINDIDIVLNAIESHQQYFKEFKTYYFPNAFDEHLIYPKPEIVKIHNIGFCGNLANRASWVNSIPEIKKDIFIIGEDMVNAINSYKIHFNRNISIDINYRTFETLGCRTLLMTNMTENLDKLFDVEKHLVVYKDLNDLLSKIDYYKKDDTGRDTIANAGYDHVINNHTYTHRSKKLLEIIREN